VTREQVRASLTALGYECSENLKRIHVPTRRVDATDPVILIEDVARVIGYEAIVPKAAAETPTSGKTSALDTARAGVRACLTGNGFLELRGVPLEPFEGEELFTQLPGASVVLQNPLNTDLARVRRSLVPFLLKTAALNARRRATTFRYFEIDKIFSRPSQNPAMEPAEHWALGILMGGAATDVDWSTRREMDFFDLKGVVESVLEMLRVPRPLFEKTDVEGYLAGTAASLVVGGERLGVIGQISPDHLASRKILNAVFAAELFLGKLVAAALPTARYEPLPRFPGVFRDLSFIVSKDVSYSAIESAIRGAAGPFLEAVDCIDVFAGKGIAAESRSMAVSMAFRAPDRTLASEEVAAAIEQVIAHLTESLGAELRG
jgi:phenylalanyl-tRNA synthetase beta chain